MGKQGKLLVLLGFVACLASVAAGCGSSSDSTSTTPVAGETSTETAAAVPTQTAPTTSKGDGGSKQKSKSGGDDGSGTPEVDTESNESGTNENGAPLGSDTSKSGDNSIETYGSNAEGAVKAEAIAAMRAFDIAIANREFGKVCAGLAKKIRDGLAESHQACPVLLKTLVTIRPSSARGSANATVTHVRVGGGNAFVLFRPPGSGKLNYFVMTREGGRWKSLGLTVGTELNPEPPPSGQ